jgi:hypothetical protein
MPQLCTFGASSARGFGLTEETGPGLPDDQFNLTTLLLPGNGTNGAQNNTFLDSSTNNFTVTRNGNTTQGTFSPFSFGGGTAQANGYYSGYFDGTGDYLTVPSNIAFAPVSGDFTVELWVYFTANPTGTDQGFVGNINMSSGDGDWLLFWRGGVSRWEFSATSNGSVGTIQRSYNTTTPSAGQWYHVVGVKNGSTLSCYVNGVKGTDGTQATVNNGSLTLNIGQGASNTGRVTGYISNVRITKGGALYSGSVITVPTTPLTTTVSAGTVSLLTCQSSQFIDNSTNAFTITAAGDSQPTVVNPFGMTDWSGYFDGTGDYLTFPELNIPSSTSFTIEFFVCWNAVPSTLSMFISEDGGNVSKYLTYNNNGTLQAQMGGNVGTVASCPFSLSSGVWYHIAFVRDTNTITIYVNGVAQTMTQATQSGAFLDVGTINYIGRWGGTTEYAFNGQMSNFRAVVGTAVYTANFTPPTAPLTAITNTQLLTCQSSTFIDNSPSARAITVNGNAYTGTLNNPFNSIVNYTTPPLQAWSNYFDGTGDYLSVTSNAAFGVGSGDFTIECWIYLTQNFDATGQGVVTASYNTNFAVIGTNSGAGNKIDFYVANSILSTGTNYISLNTWTHLAFVRLAGTTRIYFNGVQVASSGSLTGTGAAAALYVGTLSHDLNQEMTGYISNVRLVKGTAVYTAAFTPPTAPLTATANTSLLTCQSNRFVDNSINRFAITRNGDTSVQPFSPFQPDAPYSTTSVGGSAYFDGSGDYLTVPDSASFDLPGDFTVEFFAYATGSNVRRWFQLGDYRAGQNGLLIYSASFSSIVVYVNDSVIITGPTLVPYQWVHVACVRQGAGSNNLKLYVNGSLAGQVTNTTSFTGVAGNGISLGAEYGGSFSATFETYMSNVRLVKGTAVYTSAFTPPTAPLTAIADTQLLLNYTNAGIPDATAKNVLETVGNAQISTAQSKFGGSSMLFDGTGDALILPASRNLALETGNFTIEMWVYGANNGGTVGGSYPRLFSLGTVQTTGSIESYNAAGTLYVEIFGSSITFTASTLLNSSWNHFAISRSGSSVKAFVNGTQVGSTLTNSTNLNQAASSTSIIGASTASTGNFNGYIDDLRITKGYARYTTNFTPPTSAFPLF